MSRLRELREAQGLTQGELAVRAGISRQMVGAVESGRHLPRVDAALALAAALGVDVDRIFPRQSRAAVGALGQPPADGERVFAALVGERMVCAPVAREARRAEAWPAPDGVVEDGELRLLPGADPAGAVAIGCDPALGLAASLLPRSGPRRLLGVTASSAAALEALGSGRAHVALVHGTAADLGRARAGKTLRVELARWRVGLALGTRVGRARSLDDLLAGAAAVVQREPGAASQQALLRALGDRGSPEPPPGPVASDHLEVARLVSLGATAGVTMEPAALAYGLDFLPLEEHVAELRVEQRWIAEPGVQALLELVGSAAFRERARLVAGYDVSGAGSLRS